MRPVAVTLALAVLLVSACGSQSRVSSRAAARLPREVAISLAARSDALAAALRRGDGCAARIQMHGLERQTSTAIASGRVPAAYRARLRTAVSGLAGRIPHCVPPPAPAPAPPPPPAPVSAQPAPAHAPAGPKKKEHGGHGTHGKGPQKPKKHGKGGKG
jgi:hypothetical protein